MLVEKSLEAKESQTYQILRAADGLVRARPPACRSAPTPIHPEQTANAVAFGATGIGLCRTEHMFFEGNRIDAMREMILAENTEDRKKALAKLLPYQREDFVGIFKELKGFPATIRFLDPPLHEFLPHDHGSADRDLREKIGVSVGQDHASACTNCTSSTRCSVIRGCRLGIVYPEITRNAGARRVRSRCRSAEEGHQSEAGNHDPARRFQEGTAICRSKSSIASPRKCTKEKKIKLNYLVGTMIEIPRGALTADEIAQDAPSSSASARTT